ncbi:GNAT family N-acetyltransferase [uncultured Roseobacter sp.]|uniref:GNAT family N-acetyltransferase n=1 Tax=uncultured Roseobacter sp. TaxID=114847 RepID=UPI00261E814D|nr:GNAT family N-acetyltransferase [uncultured Roseobacter sp.]
MAFTVSTLTPNHAMAWLYLLREGTRAFPLGFLTSAEEAAETTETDAQDILKHGNFRGVFDSTSLIGFCGYRRSPRARLAHRAELGPFFVRAASHRQGAALAMLRAVSDEARSAGVCYLDLSVDTANFRAIRFYERAGFRRLALKPDEVRIDGIPRDDYLYRLDLET